MNIVRKLQPIWKKLSFTTLFYFLVLAVLAGCGSQSTSHQLKGLPQPSNGNSGNEHIHELIQERYPDTIGLPDLIRKMHSRAEANKFIHQLTQLMKVTVGIDLQKGAGHHDLVAHPELLLDLLQLTPQQLGAARNFVVGMARRRIPLPYENNLLPPILRVHNQLPNLVDFQNVDDLAIELLPIKPPKSNKIFFGFLRNAAEDEVQVRRNVIFSEVLERLSTNLVAEQDHPFEVVYNGQTYDRLDEFLKALRDNDHEITAIIRHYVAPFIPIYSQNDDGRVQPIAATVFERTGFFDANKQEAVLPTLHSEMVFFIKPGKNTHGQAIDAAIEYYQGIPKMGFYGYKNQHLDSWLGEKISARLAGDEAYRALLLGGYLVDMNRTLVHREKLILDGYGAVGICNDSVAVVQMAIKGVINSYPLMINSKEFLGEIERRLTNVDQEEYPQSDIEIYQTLKSAIERTPTDVVPDETALRRLYTAVPWESGQEPFYSAITARRILEENFLNKAVQ